MPRLVPGPTTLARSLHQRSPISIRRLTPGSRDIAADVDEREPELPEDGGDEADDEALVVKNADLTNVAAKDSSKPPIEPNKSSKKTDGGE